MTEPQTKNAGEDPADDETLDRLAGDWWIYQLRRGHRYSTDDVLLAWTALTANPGAVRLLDLGSGVGAVGLMTLMRLTGDGRLTSVEVQEVSAHLMRKTIARNGLADRVDLLFGDLRDEAVLDGRGDFDLITGNPPYLPPANALHSPHPQRAAARIELHGDVFDYCRTAARLLTADGRFCLCHSANDPRPETAIDEAGLVVLSRRDVVFREERPPTIALWTCAREGTRDDPPPMVVRAVGGSRTDAYREVRRALWIEA